MKVLVWVLASIFALNVVGVVVLLVQEILHRQRAQREVRELEVLWHSDAAGVRGRSTSSRTLALLAVSAIVCAVLVQAGPAPRLITSALGVVVPVILGEPTRDASQAVIERAQEQAPRDGHRSTIGLDAGSGPLPEDSPFPSSVIASSVHPAAPASLVAKSRSSTVIKLTWAEVPAATGYELERSKVDDGAWLQIATTGEQETTYVDAGLEAGTTYYYRVLATTGTGEAPPSDVVAATTAVEPPGPTTVTATSTSSTTIDLVWADVAGEAGYRVERSVDGIEWVAVGTTGPDATTFTDIGLAPVTTYLYRVFATNEGGDSPPSEFATATTGMEPSYEPGMVDTGSSPGSSPASSG